MHLHVRVGVIPAGTATPSPSTEPSPVSLNAPLQHASFSSNVSPGTIGMFIGLGVLLLAIVTFSVWLKTRRPEALPRFLRRRYNPPRAVLPRQLHRGDSHDDGPRKKPAIFDAWTGRQTIGVLKWEGSVPVSGTLITEVPVSERKAKKGHTQWFGGDDDDDDGSDDDINESTEQSEKQLTREGTGTESQLQVAILVQMPSPRRTGTHDKVNETAVLGCPVQGEMAIGIAEVPWAWAGEDHKVIRGL